jgi:ligand-binding sensor domain-containing protein
MGRGADGFENGRPIPVFGGEAAFMKGMKNIRAAVLCSLVFSGVLFVYAGTWKNYTCMKAVRALASSNSKIWAATGGGAFASTPADGTLKQYNNTEGVPSNDLTAIAVDTAQRVWAGASDGSVGVYDQTAGSWTTISAIKEADATYKSVRDFYQSGDTMFIATQIGVSVFRISQWGFGDTYKDFGLSSSAATRVAVQGGLLWVGTASGIASASLASQYLTASSAWTSYTLSSVLSSPAVTALTVFHDTLLVGTSSGAAFFAGGAFQSIGELSGKNIVNFRISGGNLFVLCTVTSGFEIDSLSTLRSSAQSIASNSSFTASDFVVVPELSVGTSTSGIAEYNGSAWTTKRPNGPNSNTMPSIAVDANGVLWAGTLPNGGGTGFYRFDLSRDDTARWKIFTSSIYPILRKQGSLFDDYYWVSIGANGSVWVSSWGNGVVKVVDDVPQYVLNHYTKPSLPGAVVNDTNYVVSGGVAVDNEGNTWIANLNTYSAASVFELTSDSTAVSYPNKLNTSSAWFHALVIDQNDTKWMANSVPSDIKEKNLYYLNENNLISGTTNGWGVLTTNEGLPSNAILSLAVDLTGSVWIGTTLGAVIISDPLYPTTMTTAYALTGQVIQSIAVDAMNRKWVGTKEGVFLVTADATELLEQYSVDNTNGMLASNDVRSIAIDQTRGIVYFGTESGLTSLTMGIVQTQAEYTNLKIYPNPYFLPNSNTLTIRNLMPDSRIKILTVSGVLVAQFDAQGAGQASWDGKNSRGSLVPSGIYIIVASTQSKKVVTGKVAVIRR